MKIGNLVMVVDDSDQPNNAIKLKKGSIHTIRSIDHDNGTTGILLEEIKNATHPIFNKELGYISTRFRLLDTPLAINIEELQEEMV